MLTVTLRGLVHGTGTVRPIYRSSNLLRAPEVRASPRPRAQRDGTVAGVELLADRRVTLTVGIEAESQAAALAAWRELAGAWQLSDVDVALDVVDDDGSWRLYGRPRLADPDLTNLAVGAIVATCRFVATDPVRYTIPEATGSTGFPSGGAGFEFPFTFPLAFGAAGVGGTIVATNGGTMPGRWRAQIAGPWVNPTIEHLGTGDELALGITVAAGQTLYLDSHGESVFLDTAHRLSAVQPGSVWPVLAPGSNEFRFGGASGSGTASLWWMAANL